MEEKNATRNRKVGIVPFNVPYRRLDSRFGRMVKTRKYKRNSHSLFWRCLMEICLLSD